MLARIGRDKCDDIAVAADFILADYRELGEARTALTRNNGGEVDVVGTPHVLRGHDLDNAGHFFSFGDINFNDVGVVGFA